LRVGQTLRIPGSGHGSPAPVVTAKAQTPTSVPRSTETTYVVHRITRGQTLSHVATRYGVSVASIQGYNGIRNPRSLRVGQQLKIPRRGGTRTAEASFRAHKVGRGQTLSHIAKLYRTTVGTLQKVNGISDPKRLRPGQVIQVPM
jgi:membrane-bound lytic murein transglycosylase D